MVGDSVAHLRESGQQVFIDAEHFFDGYRLDRGYALEVLTAAFEAGAEAVALCDTNGGMLSNWVGEIVSEVIAETGGRAGIPLHNATRCGVDNPTAAVEARATHPQGRT